MSVFVEQAQSPHDLVTKFTLAELRLALRDRGMCCSGSKTELACILFDYITQQQHSESKRQFDHSCAAPVGGIQLSEGSAPSGSTRLDSMKHTGSDSEEDHTVPPSTRHTHPIVHRGRFIYSKGFFNLFFLVTLALTWMVSGDFKQVNTSSEVACVCIIVCVCVCIVVCSIILPLYTRFLIRKK
eukprot:GHVR01165242.1.p1 GENE.GHVR01165242.1~~GHVR01165242.1.p1  ORF type:complete len:184 (-),score=37.47 GHVR01165242.1:92-643(-)